MMLYLEMPVFIIEGRGIFCHCPYDKVFIFFYLTSINTYRYTAVSNSNLRLN